MQSLNKFVKEQAISEAASLIYFIGGLSDFVLFAGFKLFNWWNTSSNEIGFKKKA